MRTTASILVLLVLAQSAHAAIKTFVVDDPGGHNIAQFQSSAPLEKIVGTTPAITGKVEFDPDDLKMPVKSTVSVDLTKVVTGISKRDEDMRGERFLNTAIYPTATLEMDTIISTMSAAKTEPGKPVDVIFPAYFTVHGVTRLVTVSGRVTYMGELPDWSKRGYPGDIMNFDGGFTMKLSDFNIARPQLLVMKLSEEVVVSVNFTATTGRSSQ